MRLLPYKLSLFVFTAVAAAGIALANPSPVHAASDLSLVLDQAELVAVADTTQSAVSTTSTTTNTAAKADNTTTTAAKTETAVIKNTKTAAQVKAENRQRWLKICKNMLVKMKKYHFRYSNGSLKSTFKKAVRKKRRSNCASYVSWCLQEYGATKAGQMFYSSSSGKVRKNFKWGSNIKVIRVNKRCSKVKLQPGDIVTWKGHPHVCIYAGTYGGHRYWYDGGKISTASNSSGSLYKNTHMQRESYLSGRTIGYIIRIKDI